MILKGNIVYMTDIETLVTVENGFLVVNEGIVEGVYQSLPEKFENEEIIDYGNKLIMPGMTDLHVHAPQYAYRGLGMDKELMQWLECYAFLEESKYSNQEYAERAYEIFSDDLLKTPTTRACVFTTIHSEASLILAKKLEKKGLITYVGKVNMDRNSPAALTESIDDSLDTTKWFIEKVLEECENTKPIITPRFVPSCSDELMSELGKLRKEFDVVVQSHLSEDITEIEFVKELNHKAKFYGDAYDMYGMFGGDYKAVMAHCVYSSDEEAELMKKNNVFMAHCPTCNTFIASGIAPVRKYLDMGLKIGLGSDVAGGYSLSLFTAIQNAIGASKLYWRLVDKTKKPLTTTEAFYLATMGGGEFFGKTGSFIPGYEADILIIDDESIHSTLEVSLKERLERLCYLADTNMICEKYVRGKCVYSR